MNFEKKREEEYCLMDLASIFLKRPVSCLFLLAPPLLHILGLRFLHLLLTSTALFFSSFLFSISVPPPSVQSSKQDHQDLNYVANNHITGESKYKPSKTNEEDEDGIIPDDESLIELSLPSGHYVGHNYTSNTNRLYIHNKVPDFRLFDLFTELNDSIEEDNLIEIDISIGSIKYSRFEVKT